MFYVALASSETLFWSRTRGQIPVTLNVSISEMIFDYCFHHYHKSAFKVQMKRFFIPEFERAAKIRKIAVYRFLISLLVPEL